MPRGRSLIFVFAAGLPLLMLLRLKLFLFRQATSAQRKSH
jgi:hypothetical protein